jgi:hypothetical protein
MHARLPRVLTRLMLVTVIAILAIGVLRSGVSSAAAARPAAVRLPALDSLLTGDLIFRAGVTGHSRIVTLFDPGSPFSHVGLVDVRDGTPHVIHIEPGNSSAESFVRRESLAAFLAPDRAEGFEVFHVNPADTRRGTEAVDAALRYQSNRVSFDHQFDLHSAETMYCTELVWRAYREAGLDLREGDGVRESSRLVRPLIRLTSLLRSGHLVPAANGRIDAVNVGDIGMWNGATKVQGGPR